ncbi:uncharacterized protein [Watersipora subatra]|uniref:uncharacterized protein n=1 Tax=Watersipora subatra TaxID=2589382 RepID=UPI00355C855C
MGKNHSKYNRMGEAQLPMEGESNLSICHQKLAKEELKDCKAEAPRVEEHSIDQIKKAAKALVAVGEKTNKHCNSTRLLTSNYELVKNEVTMTELAEMVESIHRTVEEIRKQVFKSPCVTALSPKTENQTIVESSVKGFGQHLAFGPISEQAPPNTQPGFEGYGSRVINSVAPLKRNYMYGGYGNSAYGGENASESLEQHTTGSATYGSRSRLMVSVQYQSVRYVTLTSKGDVIYAYATAPQEWLCINQHSNQNFGCSYSVICYNIKGIAQTEGYVFVLSQTPNGVKCYRYNMLLGNRVKIFSSHHNTYHIAVKRNGQLVTIGSRYLDFVIKTYDIHGNYLKTNLVCDQNHDIGTFREHSDVFYSLFCSVPISSYRLETKQVQQERPIIGYCWIHCVTSDEQGLLYAVAQTAEGKIFLLKMRDFGDELDRELIPGFNTDCIITRISVKGQHVALACDACCHTAVYTIDRNFGCFY